MGKTIITNAVTSENLLTHCDCRLDYDVRRIHVKHVGRPDCRHSVEIDVLRSRVHFNDTVLTRVCGETGLIVVLE